VARPTAIARALRRSIWATPHPDAVPALGMLDIPVPSKVQPGWIKSRCDPKLNVDKVGSMQVVIHHPQRAQTLERASIGDSP